MYDRSRCISCRACVDSSPSLWFVDADGKASLKGAEVGLDESQSTVFGKELLAEHEKAAAACPVDIIWIEDGESGERINVSSEVLFIPGK